MSNFNRSHSSLNLDYLAIMAFNYVLQFSVTVIANQLFRMRIIIFIISTFCYKY